MRKKRKKRERRKIGVRTTIFGDSEGLSLAIGTGRAAERSAARGGAPRSKKFGPAASSPDAYRAAVVCALPSNPRCTTEISQLDPRCIANLVERPRRRGPSSAYGEVMDDVGGAGLDAVEPGMPYSRAL